MLFVFAHMTEGFYGYMCQLTFDTLSLEQLPMQQRQQQQQQRQKRSRLSHKRYVKWDPHGNYTILISAETKCIADEATLEELDKHGKLTLAHVYIFKHNDKRIARGIEDVPAYEAAYRLESTGTYVRVPKGHLRKLYTQCKRGDARKMYDILQPNDEPYWVDRYIAIKKRLQ